MPEESKNETTSAPTPTPASTPSATTATATTTEATNETTTNKKGKQKKVKKIPEGLVIPPKKPKLTKAERRALQEAQRAASTKNKNKQGGGGGGGKKGDGKSKEDGKNKEDGKGGGASGASGKGKQDSKKKGSASGGVKMEKDSKTLSFFSHLPPFKDRSELQQEFSGIKLGSNTVPSASASSSSSNQQHHHNFHPAIRSLGQNYANGSIRGANARCKAMLQTFKIVIGDFLHQREKEQNESTSTLKSSSKQKDIRQEIEQTILKPAFSYWSAQCRTHSVTMGNAFTFLKLAVASLDRDMHISEMNSLLMETMDAYIEERIEFADKAICNHACSKIVDGDVLLVFGYSEVIHQLLITASKEGKKFRVIIVDSRPLLEGRILLQKLLSNNEESREKEKMYNESELKDDDSDMNMDGDGSISSSQSIECTYILLNALSYVMKEVTKVFLGAAALMCDGSVLSRVGTASIALMAKSQHIPVLVCCETYKINNRVQLESITHNELGNPDDLIATKCALDTSGDVDCDGKSDTVSGNSSDGVLKNWRDTPNLKLLNLLYDLTPSEFVSGIVTEMGILPPTSVAVLLREMNPQDNGSSFNSEAVY